MTDISKRLGYGGSATIDGTQVLITAGSFDEALTPGTLDMLDLPGTAVRRSRVQHGDGVKTYTGSISFDVSRSAMAFLNVGAVMMRNYQYVVGIHDGDDKYRMTDCITSSLSISGAPGGLITASLSFSALQGKTAAGVTNSYILDDSGGDQPAAYWWSGAEDVRDWNFSYSQDVVPVYLNQDTVEPQYLRSGLSSYSLQVTTYSEIEHATIDIITSAFTLTGYTTGKSFAFNGPNDLGMYSNTFETAAVNVSNNTVIT